MADDFGPIRASLEDTLEACGLDMRRHGAVAALARLLADQIDDAGVDVSTRLTASYLSTLKDIERAIGTAPAGSPGTRVDQLRRRADRLRRP